MTGNEQHTTTSASSLDEKVIRANTTRVQAQLASACARAGRSPTEVALVAVSKTQSAEAVAAAYAAGLRIFGENRVEEAGPKAEVVARLLGQKSVTWHMVGHVQSRKVRDVLPWASMVHSVDSMRVATRLSRACVEAGRELAVLLEVNVTGEESKFGFRPDDLPEWVPLIGALPGLRLEGLMTMAQIVTASELARPAFTRLRQIRDDLRRRFPNNSWQHLSMGMTDDFEIAIEEGATLVRIGRAIFGERMR